jgi:hypothetical protein
MTAISDPAPVGIFDPVSLRLDGNEKAWPDRRNVILKPCGSKPKRVWETWKIHSIRYVAGAIFLATRLEVPGHGSTILIGRAKSP